MSRALSPSDLTGPGNVIALTIPWGALCGDNHRLIPAGNGRKGLIASKEYRLRKQAATHFIRRQCVASSFALIVGDVMLHARLYFPDRRKRDAGNYRKAVTDAMTGIVYGDDSQVIDERWERAGFDKHNPRCEIIVKPAEASLLLGNP